MVYLTHYWYTIRKWLANYKYRKQLRESQKNVKKYIVPIVSKLQASSFPTILNTTDRPDGPNILWPIEVENFYLSEDPKGYVKAFTGLAGAEMVDEDLALDRLKKIRRNKNRAEILLSHFTIAEKRISKQISEVWKEK